MSKGLRNRELRRARELAAERLSTIQQDSLSSYIQWAKSAPQWGYIIDILKDRPDLWSKVGETQRGWLGPSMRCEEEWYKKFPGAILRHTFPLMLDETHYVRDYYLHRVLLDMKFKRVTREELFEAFHSKDAYSQEIFECTLEDVFCAYYYIIESFKNGTIDLREVYTIKKVDEQPEEKIEIVFRPLQQDLIDNVVAARAAGRDHLLSYSCPRFGKSACTMGTAMALDVNSLLVVSAVASVHDEWKKTVENILNFSEEWVFVDADMLSADPLIAGKLLDEGKRVLIFLTLQDIQGDEVKARHAGVLDIDFDMMAVDESHIGARGESFAAKLGGEGESVSEASEDDIAAAEDNKELLDYVGAHFSYAFSLHLSGTPYNIMLTDEFSEADIVSQVSYSDILHAKRQWNREHPKSPEWDNPYFDFPELLTMGIALDANTSELFRTMKEHGLGELTDIFAIDEEKNLLYPDLVYRFFAALDGTCPDNGIYALMTDAIVSERVQSFQGVFILSRRAQVDAVVDWLEENRDKFKNLGKWRFLRATSEGKYMKAQQIKDAVDDAYENNVNTMTFTVGKMMTGMTVKPWNFMINARPSSDMQFYDQSKARLLSGQSVDIVITAPNGEETYGKQVLKQQSIFIDLVANRPMEISAAKAQMRAYSEENKHLTGEGVEKALAYEMGVMPHIVPQVMMDNISTLFVPVEPVDVMKVMSRADAKRSLTDQTMFARTVNDKWKNDPVIGEWYDRTVAMALPESVKVLMDAFSSKDGIYSEIDIDDVDGLSGLVDDAKEWAKRRHDELSAQKKELLNKKKEGLSEEEKARLEETSKQIEEIKKIEKEAKKIEKETFEKQRRLILLIATYVWCAPFEIRSYKDAIKSLGHKYNSRYKECIRIAHNLGLNSTLLANVYTEAREVDRFELDQIAFRMYNICHDESLSDMGKIDALFNNFPKIDKDELLTPMWVCEKMSAAINDATIADCVQNNENIVGFAEEVGEFSIAMYQRMKKLGYSHDEIAKTLVSIPQSSLAYEMTRKAYEMFGLDVRNIARDWDANALYDMLIKDEKDGGYGKNYKMIADTLSRSKSGYLCDTTLDKDETKEYRKMIKFGAIVGNPPYQVTRSGEAKGDDSIFDEFMDCCEELAPRSYLITPARFLFEAGRDKTWCRKKLADPHRSVVEYYQKSNEIFPGTDIKGGVAITAYEIDEEKGPIIFYTTFPEMNTILSKVVDEKFESVQGIIYLQEKFDLDELNKLYPVSGKLAKKEKRITTNAFTKYAELFSEEKDDNHTIKMIGLIDNVRYWKYISEDILDEHDNLMKYKVILPGANGSGAIGEILSTPLVGEPLVGEPLVGHTQSFISFGCFDTEAEARACYKYICSKFARFMLGIRKTTQHNPPEKWAYVPLQDFTSDSDIDWSKSITEIDQQLYKKYGLTDDEIAFIETNVKTME